MPDYHPAFRKGESVQVADEQTLRTFQQEWTFHHPLQEEQMAYAAKRCFVEQISVYHGGACLYELSTIVKNAPPSRFGHKEAVPGFWHEACLHDQDLHEWNIPLPLASEVYCVTAELRNDQPVVLVRTHSGMECLVIRHLQNEDEAALMAQVAGLRNTLSFEWRYNFQGVAHDALRQRALKRQSKSEE